MTVEDGHPEQSEALLTNALAELESLKAIDDEAEGYVTLVRCFLSAGKSSEAGKAAAKAAPIIARSHDRGVHLAFAIVNARVAAAAGDSTKAAESLKKTLAEANKLGYAVYAFETRLALGEIEVKSGHADEGRRHLAELEKDAATAGFSLIARKAANARG